MLTPRLAILIAVLAGCVCGCSPECPASTGTAHAPPASVRRIAVIPKGTSHEFWQAVERGARKADAEIADIEIVWKGPVGEGATQDQIALVESITSGSYAGICLAPLDGRALAPAVRNAIRRKIPVVLFDSALTDPDVAVATLVATQNRRGGEIAGEELARALKGKGDVLVVRYQSGSLSTTEREEGCLAALAAHPDIRVIASENYAGPEESDAVVVSENLLSKHGGTVDGVFCPNESTTSGFLTALKRDSRGLSKDLVVVGFDLSKRIVQALESGALHATVAQDPESMGYRAVLAMRDRLDDKALPPRIETPQTLVLRETLSTSEVKRLLEPFESR
jgi:ribose transport system substrate-binding protein